ncbi:MAG: response regulator [Thaumarchaeota archaeon]|nr:response regulator [Nitrososphaerota archaeon]MCL5318632.1 response regulator [Nitrososphaerota archaeon]
MQFEKARILIIDDDEDILNMWTAILMSKGFEVDTAKTGRDAIEKLKVETYNISIIDIVLPDMQGTQILAHMQKSAPETRRIMLTGNATVENAIASVNLEADAYIEKPVKSSELLKVIDEQLQKQQEEQAMTWEKVANFLEANKIDFQEFITQSLNAVLGESATSATIYHMGGEESLRDPTVFAEKLRTIFEQEGAEAILKYIRERIQDWKKEPSDQI